jgi:hypothetical protein
VMKPNPLASLNHLTVPRIRMSYSSMLVLTALGVRPCRVRRVFITVADGTFPPPGIPRPSAKMPTPG